MPGILGDIIPPVLEDQHINYSGYSTGPTNDWMFDHWENPEGIYRS